MPLISVIVPVYKVEDCLHPCIDSILAQTFTDYELILIDDGSPDNCGAICDEYAAKDNRVHVIHQENGGLSAARNAGIDVAKGKYLTFIDSDDAVQHTFLQVLVDLIQRSSADVSACQRSDFTKSLPVLKPSDDKVVTYSGHDAVLEMYTERPFVRISAWGKLYDAKLFNGIQYPIGKIHEDQAVTPIVVSKAAHVVVSNQKLYCYRIREESITHSGFTIRNYDDVEAVKGCISYFENNGETELAAAAKKKLGELIAFYSLHARKQGIYKQVPKQYRMGHFRALRWLRKNLSDDKYIYRLDEIHPDWIRAHEYMRKVKKTFHIPCK